MSNRAVEPGLDLVVHDRRGVAEGVVAIDLTDPTGAALPAWAPGAHVDLLLTDDLVRQYSLCGDPADRGRWRIAVLREQQGRGGSQFVHDNLYPGAAVRVRGPRNNFDLAAAARYLFLAGGIGITPILPMVAEAQGRGADWRLVYGGRNAASMAFSDELRAAHGRRVELRPEDEYGLLDLAGLLREPADGTLIYCCGPGALLDAVERQCATWPAGSVRVERFRPVQPDGSLGHFQVELATTGAVLTVPSDRSVLEVVEDAGVSVLSSCREGTCGTCEVSVLGGEVDHRDSLLDPAERAAHDTMFICVSRATGVRLILDL